MGGKSSDRSSAQNVLMNRKTAFVRVRMALEFGTIVNRSIWQYMPGARRMRVMERGVTDLGSVRTNFWKCLGIAHIIIHPPADIGRALRPAPGQNMIGIVVHHQFVGMQ